MERRTPKATVLHAAVTFAICTVLTWPGACLAQTYKSFDGPGAGTGQAQGTFPTAITRNGLIGGIVIDSNSVARGFIRLTSGKFRPVQPPHSRYTYLVGLNWHRQAAGTFFDSNPYPHGYVKNADGTYVQIDVPSATGGTQVAGINSNGQIVGNFVASGGQQEAFFWDPTNPSEYVTFTVSGSAGTNGLAINDNGEITGNYTDSAGVHGYVRTIDGTITTFDFGGTSTFTSPVAINTKGEVTGEESDESFVSGFVRTPFGTLSLWETQENGGPVPQSINDAGVIVGFETSDSGGDIAFERDAAGNFALLAVPFPNTDTRAESVNQSGYAVGTYMDPNGVTHGWLLTP